MRDDSRTKPTAERLIVRDEARQLRLRLKASRMAVPKQLDEMAGGRRGLKLADHLSELADTMLAGRWSPDETTAALARLSMRIVEARLRRTA
jgi:hypothetical protein